MNINSSPVVITGLGLMTGLGINLADSWQGLVSGRSVTAPFRNLDPARLSCPFGVELPAEADELFQAHIKKRKRSQMTRSTQISLLAAEMAIDDARLDLELLDRTRVGVVLGSTGTAYIPDDGRKEDMRILKNMPNSPVSWISLTWKLNGPSFIIGTACSSGVYAMGAAYGLIRSGQCDVVLCGSADSSINYPDIEGFCDLLALADATSAPETASRPFDARRSGFVIGEGGGILVLESLEHTRRRNARIYAEMHYPGFYTESYNILSPEPGGKGMARCIQRALQQSGLTPADIDYINAHGTSTNLNDLYETSAIKMVFGDKACGVPVSSTKSMTGHCLAGSGGVEAVISCKALYEGIIPPTINLTHPDPKLDLDYVPLQARNKELRHVMSNSFAFGGHNGVQIFSRYNASTAKENNR
jgi:3-oxoacyl-[acyl-carrier-protein] synthase II